MISRSEGPEFFSAGIQTYGSNLGSVVRLPICAAFTVALWIALCTEITDYGNDWYNVNFIL